MHKNSTYFIALLSLTICIFTGCGKNTNQEKSLVERQSKYNPRQNTSIVGHETHLMARILDVAAKDKTVSYTPKRQKVSRDGIFLNFLRALRI